MIIYLIFNLIIFTQTSNKAILISSSLGFYNYRQGSNILKIYHHLKDKGFKDQDIILMLPENGKCNLRNNKLGTISFYDGDHNDICKNVEVDYSHSDMKLTNVYNNLILKYPQFTLNSKRIKTNKDTNLLIYFSGHGGDDYFKLLEREAILKEHLKSLTDYLSNNNLYSKLLLLSDSCSASTIFQDIKAPNIISIGSSSRQQKSLSYGYDLDLNAAKSDGFTYYLDMFLNQQVTQSTTVKKLFEYLDFAKLSVNSKMQSTFSKGTNKIRINQFFTQKKQKSVSIDIDDINKLDQFANYLLEQI